MVILFTKKDEKTKNLFLSFLKKRFKNLDDHKMIITNKKFNEELVKILEDDTVVLINFEVTKKQLSRGTWPSVFYNIDEPGYYWIAVTKSFFERIDFNKKMKDSELVKMVKEELNEDLMIKLVINNESTFNVF